MDGTPNKHFGHEYYYVIHGHGGIHPQINLTGKVDNARIIFYCHDGESTSDAHARNPNLNWQFLFNKLTSQTWKSLPDTTLIAETIDTKTTLVPPLILSSDPDIPFAGVYFCCRENSGENLHVKIKSTQITISDTGTPLITLITKIANHAQKQGLGEFDIHVVACRIHIDDSSASDSGDDVADMDAVATTSTNDVQPSNNNVTDMDLDDVINMDAHPT